MTYCAIPPHWVIDFFIASGMMRSLLLSRRFLSYYVRIFSPRATPALWAFAVHDLYRGFKYTGSLMVITSTVADWQVGMVSSSYFTGNLVGTLIAGRFIQQLGFNRSYHCSCILFALATCGLMLTVDFWSWLGWRFLAGIACALIWVIVESALLRSGTLTNRGQLLAAYMMVYYLGTVIGQLLLGIVSTQLLSVIPWWGRW